MLGRRRRWSGRLLGLAIVTVLVGAPLPAVAAGATVGGVALTLGSDGSLSAVLTTVVTNGSALRYAMDGNFTPLVDALPGNNSTRQNLLNTISVAERLAGGLFGDHDGRVDSVVDVPRFQSLILNEVKLIPLSTITGALNLTLDGNPATGQHLQAISFNNAVGLDTSPAAIDLTATLVGAFSWNAAAATHVFVLAWNLPSILGNFTIGVPSVNLSFATPPALDITSATGLNGTQISNDQLGWGSASVSGQYSPRPGTQVAVEFGHAFPTGDALIVGAVAVAAGALVGLLLLRRRRRNTGPPPTPPAGTGVGPSSGSE